MKYTILKRSDFILKTMGSFGGFQLGDGLVKYAMQNVILTALWKLLKMGKTGVQETVYETPKVNKTAAVMMKRSGFYS